MIKLLRVDDRLIHGAVAFSWTKELNINLIILANDKVAHDEFQKMTLDIAKPRGTTLICVSVDDSIIEINKHLKDSVNTMIIANNIPDAKKIMDAVPEINSLNLGGIRKKDDTVENLIGAIAVNKEDIEICKNLVAVGKEVELRLIPDGKKTFFKDYNL